MQFGLLYELQVAPGDSVAQVYWDALEQIALADRLGYDYIWEVEHHFLEDYSASSAPEVMLGAVSQRTERIRIAHGVCTLLPNMNPPARVAERTAALDIISHGRLDVGTGRASTREELGGFCVEPEDTREMWRESLQEIVKMWTDTPYQGHEGRFFSMPARNVIPKPLQQPHPPLWMACTDPETISIAARNGIGAAAFSIGTPEKMAERIRLYHDLADTARPIGKFINRRIAATSFMYCGATDAEAREIGIPAAQYFSQQLQRYFSSWSDPNYSGSSYAAHREVYKVRPGGVDGEKLIENGTWLVGTPASLRATLRKWEATGVDQMILMAQVGGTSHADTMRSIQRFAEEVMPEFAGRVAVAPATAG